MCICVYELTECSRKKCAEDANEFDLFFLFLVSVHGDSAVLLEPVRKHLNPVLMQQSATAEILGELCVCELMHIRVYICRCRRRCMCIRVCVHLCMCTFAPLTSHIPFHTLYTQVNFLLHNKSFSQSGVSCCNLISRQAYGKT